MTDPNRTTSNVPPSDASPSDSQPRTPHVEEFRVSGDTLVSKLQEILQEGNARRVLIKTQDGNVLLDIPLTFGAVGGLIGVSLFPLLAVVAGIGAIAAKLTLVVERRPG